MIRLVSKEDAEAIALIYNYYVENSTISFEETPVSDVEIGQRINKVLDTGLPWLVHESDGKVNGYAYATPWRERSAYRFSVESTVYVAHDAAQNGIGSDLYQKLITQLKEKSIRNVFGVIALPNTASERLHQKLGFVKSGVLKQVGYKFDQWIDVAYWQLEIR